MVDFTFNDLRGTAVTRLAQAEATVAEIATITRIDTEATPDAARQEAFAEMATRQTEAATRTARAEVVSDNTDPAAIATRAGEALFARSHPEHQLSDAARAHAGLTIPDIARECLRRSGIPTSGTHTETLVTRALHATSDFPAILEDAAIPSRPRLPVPQAGPAHHD